MKAMTGSAFLWSVPGVTSTTPKRRTRFGWSAARQMAVSPPRDMPTTASALGASASIATATSPAMDAGP